MMRKNILLVKLEDGQKKQMIYCSLVFLSPKEEVEIDEPLYNYPKNNRLDF